MREALAMALRGQGCVEPNPMVGCILVASDGTVIGRGFHQRFGGLHAEREALADARHQGNANRIKGCTAYVTLEPCCHHGKTPPCTQALLEAGVGRVVVAMLDPFEQVAGKGCAELREHGIDVAVGLESQAARQLNAPYLTRILRKRPWVIAKWAMSADGKIATRTGHSQWISCEASRADVHRLRGRVDVVMVGRGTAIADDPLLTARTDSAPRKAMRVVVDSQLKLPAESKLVKSASEGPVLIWAGPDADTAQAILLESAGVKVHIAQTPDPNTRLEELLHYLATEMNVTNVLVEGGGGLLGGLMHLNAIDECQVFIAPKLIGGAGAISPIAGQGFERVDDGPPWELVDVERVGVDAKLVLVRGGDFRGR